MSTSFRLENGLLDICINNMTSLTFARKSAIPLLDEGVFGLVSAKHVSILVLKRLRKRWRNEPTSLPTTPIVSLLDLEGLGGIDTSPFNVSLTGACVSNFVSS
mmetsp:Transcript_4883/g.7127  ORF Transcript_4883/g.7127 Transcript_4883/m.7127 type:complete len:103 (-) Transcript_4883:274-582(-)